MGSHNLAKCLVCADDYGHSFETNAAIRELLEAGVVNATTCLVEGDSWEADGPRLRELVARGRSVSIGLHLNLTEQLSAGGREPVSPMWLSLDRSIEFADKLYERFLGQWDAYVRIAGAQPDFIDGHQHVHLAPAARAALFRLVERVGFQGWIRQCRTSSSRGSAKRLILDRLSDVLAAAARARNLQCNPGFGGLRSFHQHEDVLALWTRDLAGMRQGGVLMVHPGAHVHADPIGKCRVQEASLLRFLPAIVREFGLTLQWDVRSGW
ncbi:MAG: ChbG/HpnK family deacetylase [Proteobacteria bacterium]|nr:ChbG/HpnK family deacetylase [Pseudomonadota bacterium]